MVAGISDGAGRENPDGPPHETTLLEPRKPGSLRHAEGVRKTAHEGLFRPALVDGIAVVHPVVPAADQRAHVGNAALFEQERRTGARGFVVSGAVGDNRFFYRLQAVGCDVVLIRPGLPAFER